MAVQPRIAVVGAGLAGIAAAIALKKQLNFENFTIYERAISGVGGTWRDNTYPGCGSDIPGHWYSLSTELNPNWSSYFVSQPEILAYWENLWHKYALENHTQFGTNLCNADWDEGKGIWDLTLQDVVTGEKRKEQANVIIGAIGGFQGPMFPKDISGKENFDGPVWHSARWRQDVDLKGKTVAVIGNGCSAAQLVPNLSSNSSVKVVNFCRTPQWYIGAQNYRYPFWVKWMFAHVPLVMRFYRNWIMFRSDIGAIAFNRANARILNLVRKLFTAYLKKKAPEKYWNKIIPSYAVGCKRIIVDPGYLESLHRPNVEVRWEAIEAIVSEGIKLKDGEIIPLDAIIFSTGYSLEIADMNIQGRNGLSLKDFWRSQGGPAAYMGCTYPGFPNFITLLGPNVATGHASVIFSEEALIQLAIKFIKPIIHGQTKSFEIKESAFTDYNKWVQQRIKTSVFTDCVSYYRGQGGRVFATWPGPVALFWWLSSRPRWDDWRILDKNGLPIQRARVPRWGAWSLIMVLVGVAVYSPRKANHFWEILHQLLQRK